MIYTPVFFISIDNLNKLQIETNLIASEIFIAGVCNIDRTFFYNGLMVPFSNESPTNIQPYINVHKLTYIERYVTQRMSPASFYIRFLMYVERTLCNGTFNHT